MKKSDHPSRVGTFVGAFVATFVQTWPIRQRCRQRLRPSLDPGNFSSGTAFTLTWSAVSGRSYWLQYKTDLATGNWTDLPPAVLASGPTATATDTNAASRRFYRIRLEN